MARFTKKPHLLTVLMNEVKKLYAEKRNKRIYVSTDEWIYMFFRKIY